MAQAIPTRLQRQWADQEVGMFIHFAPNTWQDREGDDLSTPLGAIDPAGLDTDQWARTAAAMGARYVVLVAKHVGGFCLWPTTTTDYAIHRTPWRGGKGDVVGDLAASCRRMGLKFGFYLSPRDDHRGAGIGGVCADPARQAAYTEVYRRQLTELLTGYGPIFEVWFDGNLTLPVADLLDRHARRAIQFQGPRASIRWVGNEDGVAPYPTWNAVQKDRARSGEATGGDGDPDGEAWLPAEVDVSIRRPNWFWSTTNHVRLLTLEQLLGIYYRAVGRGANLLLNVTPDTTGRIPEADAARAKELGDAVRRRFGRAVGATVGEGESIELRLRRMAMIDHVILQERLEDGERVRGYVVEGKTEAGWTELGRGSAIGHKRLQPVPPTRIGALRLRVTASAAPPRLRRFAAYATGEAPPPDWDR